MTNQDCSDHLRHLAVALACIGTSLAVSAQSFEDEARNGIADASLTSPNSASTSQITMFSTSDDTSVAAQLAMKTCDGLDIGLKVVAPVKSDSEATLATLSGLTSGSTATFSVSKISLGPLFDETRILDVCDRYNESLRANPDRIEPRDCSYDTLVSKGDAWANKADETVHEVLDAHLAKKRRALPGSPVSRHLAEHQPREELAADAEAMAEAEESARKALGNLCEDYNEAQRAKAGYIRTSGASECTYANLQKLGFKWSQLALQQTQLSPTLLSLSASVNNQDFTFHDEDTLEEQTDSREGYALTLTLGKYLPLHSLYFGIHGSRERSHRGGSSTELCVPDPEHDRLECDQYVLSSPVQIDRSILQAEARWLLGPLAVNPRVSYDFEQEQTEYRLLLFFLEDATKGLNGGVDLIYLDEDDDFSMRLFVGRSFDLLPI